MLREASRYMQIICVTEKLVDCGLADLRARLNFPGIDWFCPDCLIGNWKRFDFVFFFRIFDSFWLNKRFLHFLTKQNFLTFLKTYRNCQHQLFKLPTWLNHTDRHNPVSPRLYRLNMRSTSHVPLTKRNCFHFLQNFILFLFHLSELLVWYCRWN